MRETKTGFGAKGQYQAEGGLEPDDEESDDDEDGDDDGDIGDDQDDDDDDASDHNFWWFHSVMKHIWQKQKSFQQHDCDKEN